MYSGWTHGAHREYPLALAPSQTYYAASTNGRFRLLNWMYRATICLLVRVLGVACQRTHVFVEDERQDLRESHSKQASLTGAHCVWRYPKQVGRRPCATTSPPL